MEQAKKRGEAYCDSPVPALLKKCDYRFDGSAKKQIAPLFEIILRMTKSSIPGQLQNNAHSTSWVARPVGLVRRAAVFVPITGFHGLLEARCLSNTSI